MPTLPLWTLIRASRVPAFAFSHPCPFFASSCLSWESSLVAFVAPGVRVIATLLNVLLQLMEGEGFGHLVHLPRVATRLAHSRLKETLQLGIFKHQIPGRQAAVIVVDF